MRDENQACEPTIYEASKTEPSEGGIRSESFFAFHSFSRP